MAYFSNGSMGASYENNFCYQCRHGGFADHGCPIMLAHMIDNADGANNKDHYLHKLIPIGDDGLPAQCNFFSELPENETPQWVKIERFDKIEKFCEQILDTTLAWDKESATARQVLNIIRTGDTIQRL